MITQIFNKETDKEILRSEKTLHLNTGDFVIFKGVTYEILAKVCHIDRSVYVFYAQQIA